MKKIILFYLFILCMQFGFSQKNNPQALVLDFNLIDLPAQVNSSRLNGDFIRGFEKPTMNQSLTTSTNFYSSIHFGINQSFRIKKSSILDKFLKTGLTSGIDYIVSTLPFGNAWLHEEYHRAVLNKHLIESRNDVYPFKLFPKTISVSNVKDADLENLANNYHSDFVRLQSAGGEAQINQIRAMEFNNFFYSQNLPNTGSYWLSTLGNIFYMKACTNFKIDKELLEGKNIEGTDVSIRDFTGLDYIAWADALVHPEKAYSQRGIHPSGVGIDRALLVKDLSPEALDYLKLQTKLHWLNIASPAMFFFDRIKLKTTEKGVHYGNFAFRHTLSPFGYDLSLDLFYESPKYKMVFTVHNYNSKNLSLLGIDAQLVDYKVLKNQLSLSPKLMFWMQPENESFYAEKYKTGALLSIQARYEKTAIIKPYLSIETKTKGFVMGNVYLESNFAFRAGLQFDIAAKKHEESPLFFGLVNKK